MKPFLFILMLFVSNTFMLFAWYGHLRFGAVAEKPLPVIVLCSWLIAFAEYSFMIPANRIGASLGLSVAQLRVLAEAVSLIVLIPFSICVMHEKPRLDYLWAFLCLLGAVYFVNRSNF